MKKKFWKGRNVFITGSTGLLGYWVTKYLVEAGANVIALVHKGVPEIFKSTFSKVNIVRGDINDYKKILTVLKKNRIETVFHLAAQTVSPIANKNPIPTFETNIQGTWVLLEACRNTKSIGRIVVASSDKAYGEDEQLPFTEKSRLNGIRPYTVSKSCADLITTAYYKTYGMPICITRCGNFFGGGDLLMERLLPSVIKAALFEKELIIRSDGKFVRDFFYVEDGALATIMLAESMEKKEIWGEDFNFSYEKPITVIDFVNIFFREIGSSMKPKVLNQPLNEIREQYLSCEKARKLLSWEPVFSFEEGIGRTIAWYRDFFKRELQKKN